MSERVWLEKGAENEAREISMGEWGNGQFSDIQLQRNFK